MLSRQDQLDVDKRPVGGIHWTIERLAYGDDGDDSDGVQDDDDDGGEVSLKDCQQSHLIRISSMLARDNNDVFDESVYVNVEDYSFNDSHLLKDS